MSIRTISNDSIAIAKLLAVVAGYLAISGCGAGDTSDSTPAIDPNRRVAKTGEALTTCVTIQRTGANGAVADAQMAFNASTPSLAATNFGGSTAMAAGVSLPQGDVRKSLVRFDLSAIPPDAQINSAQMTLRSPAFTGIGPINVDEVTGPWSEGLVTWNNFTGGTSPLTSFSAGPGPQVVPLPLSLVQRWIGSPCSNNGVMLSENTASSNITFRTSEYTAVNDRPRLDICYAPAPPPCPNGRLAWWTGDTSAGLALDVAGGHNGTFVNGAASVAGAKVGASTLSFDGIDDYVTAPHDPALGSGGPITVEGWINAVPFSNYHGIIGKITATEPRPGWLMFIDDTTNRLGCYMGISHLPGAIGVTYGTVFSSGPVADNQWHHVACTYEGSAIRIYVDGVSCSAYPYTAGYAQTTEPVMIGSDPAPFAVYGNRHYQGLIDEMSIYDRELSAIEIASIYTAGAAGKCAP